MSGDCCAPCSGARRTPSTAPASGTRPPLRAGGATPGRVSKKAQQHQAHLVFLEESGFRLPPTRRRTWAPRGQTPIQKCWERPARLSVGGALTCPPRRRRLGFSFRLHSHNIRTPHVLAFLRLLQRQVHRPLLLVLERWSGPRAAVAHVGAQRPPWLGDVSWLPSYAPALNPVEQIGNPTTSRELANYLPEDLAALHEAVGFSLASTRFQQTRLRSCFRYAKLQL